VQAVGAFGLNTSRELCDQLSNYQLFKIHWVPCSSDSAEQRSCW